MRPYHKDEKRFRFLTTTLAITLVVCIVLAVILLIYQ